MAIELKVPTVGESITEVQMGEWLKGEGDSVARDEVIAKIETDKVTVDLTAPNDGVLSQIKVKKGQTANVGDVIAYIEEGAAGSAKPKAAEPAKAEAPKAEARKAEPPAEERSKSVRPTIPPQGFARVMPSARRALKERGLSPDDVEATGPGGRVLKEDVDRLKDKPVAKAPVAQDRQEEVVAMSPFRKRIAERLVQSQQTAALLTTFNEVDMGAVMELRKSHQEAFQEKYGIKLGFMSFFVKATIEALKLIPSVNAEIRGNDIVYKNFYDIGVAVGGGKGLAVPIIRNAERLGFAEVELAIADFGKRAKDNKLELSELQGGTFTISNGGIYGSMMSTPIVNPPQSGILGLHAIQDRPMAVKGQVVIRPMMYIALTYDHRLVDGREAVTFLKRIKQCMEEPARILLEV
ncbi:MAG TPA: 2-oxoglutarate dehydrogenase complex dihydrolipoyllysine-residue succinyltransferase [Polyangiaceae bacterium]|jgi:2-oxoglutarate dehydrogenase E2 component (dihydrolipoamide succinyltransferase)|nr:2-oxoglutarate dehydrogenase complex dihydrolipoyllysine-residue succinyltransferase [Polyangiaceae bacterium]